MFGFLKKISQARRDRIIEGLLARMIDNNIYEYESKRIYWEAFVGYCCDKTGDDFYKKCQEDFVLVNFNYRGVEYEVSFLYIRFPLKIRCVTITIDTPESSRAKLDAQFKLLGIDLEL